MKTVAALNFKVILPTSDFYRTWQQLILVTLFVNGIIIPIQNAFGFKSAMLIIINFLIDGVLLGDMFVRSNLSYMDKGFYITLYKETSKRYFNSREAWFDIFFNLPWDLFCFISSDPWLLWAMIRYIKWFRTFKIILWFQKYEDKLDSSNSMTFVKFFMYILFITVNMGSGWYLLGGCTVCLDTWGSIYIKVFTQFDLVVYSMYWTIATMTTTGYGDIHPVNTFERVFASSLMIMGVILYGYIGGGIASILSNMDSRRVHYKEKVDAIQTYMTDHHLPSELQERVIAWYFYSWERSKGIDVSQVFADLPTSFRADVAVSMNYQTIIQTEMFGNCSASFRRMLSLSLTIQYFTKDTIIVHQGELTKELYFIIQGRVDVMHQLHSLSSLVENSYFGEFMLILNQPCEFDYKAFTNCDVYTITYEVYNQICLAYPGEAEKVFANTKKRYTGWKETSKKWLRKVDKKDNEAGRRKSSFAFFMQDAVKSEPTLEQQASLDGQATKEGVVKKSADLLSVPTAPK